MTNKHYTNCLKMLDMHHTYLAESMELTAPAKAETYAACMELARQSLMRAHVEALLAGLTENQING